MIVTLVRFSFPFFLFYLVRILTEAITLFNKVFAPYTLSKISGIFHPHDKRFRCLSDPSYPSWHEPDKLKRQPRWLTSTISSVGRLLPGHSPGFRVSPYCHQNRYCLFCFCPRRLVHPSPNLWAFYPWDMKYTSCKNYRRAHEPKRRERKRKKKGGRGEFVCLGYEHQKRRKTTC